MINNEFVLKEATLVKGDYIEDSFEESSEGKADAIKLTYIGLDNPTYITLSSLPDTSSINVEETVAKEPKPRLIKSIGYNQHAIIRDILDLHCGGSPTFDCDITISKGCFYGSFKRTYREKDESGKMVERVETFEIPLPKYKFDVSPQIEGCEPIDPWGPIPLPDNSIDSIMVDLPFVIGPRDCASMVNPKKGSNTVGQRFSSYYPRYEMFASYEHWLQECYRVLKDGGVLVWKSQPVISGGVNLMTPYYTCRVAEDLGFYIKDEFVLLAKQRLISGKVKKQEHSRRFHSYFHVFVKNDPKKDKTGYWVREWKQPKRKISGEESTNEMNDKN